jgi:UDPglucose 6-dehydrogenase
VNADALVIVTEWEQFRALDLPPLRKEMAQPVIVDLRNIYRPDEMAEHGFTYESVGRPADPRWRDGGPSDRRGKP